MRTMVTHPFKFPPSFSLAFQRVKRLLKTMKIKIPKKYKENFILLKIRTEIDEMSN